MTSALLVRLRARQARTDIAHEAAFAVAVMAAAAVALSLAGRHSGWPIGQSFGNVLLVQIYAAHLRHGDLLPIWSSSDAYGMGSPAPLFYHHVFFMVAGVVYIVTGGAIKTTMLLSLGAFMVVGAYGMRRALKLITTRRLLAAIGSLGYLFTNYAFTDWFIRGDPSEFAALMLMPWLLHWCVDLVKNRHVSLSLIPVMVILVCTHSAVAALSLVFLVVALMVFCARAGRSGLLAAWKRLGIVAGVTTAMLAPLIVASLRMGAFYDPLGNVQRYGAKVQNQFRDPVWYFVDPGYHWLSAHNTQPVLVQVDFLLWVPLALALVTAVVDSLVLDRRRATRATRSTRTTYVNRPTMLTIEVSLAVFLFLQLRVSTFVYDLVGAPLKAISYPYRMLSLITPLALLATVAVADAFLSRIEARFEQRAPLATRLAAPALCGGWLVSLIAMSPLTSSLPAPVVPGGPVLSFVPLSSVTEPSHESFETARLPALYDDFLPEVERDGRRLYSSGALYAQLHARHVEGESLGHIPCKVSEPADTAFETLEITYSVRCAGATRVALPVSYNPFTTIDRIVGSTLERLSTIHILSDPRIVVYVPDNRPETLVVHLPTLWSMLG